MQLKLYGYWRSSAAYRIRIALNLKQLKYELAPVDLRKGEQHHEELKSRNPQAMLPVLTHGDRVFRQSMAIIEYLDETFEGRGYRLMPVELRERARVRAISQTLACDIHPLNNLRVLGALETRFGASEAQQQDWMRHWMHLGFAALETLLAENPSTGEFCEGDAPTMADCCLIPQVYNALRFNLDMLPFPTIERIYRTALALPEFAAAQPESQPDASA